MIKTVEMYTVICDGCGKDVNKGEEYSCWNDEGYARETAIEADWHEDDDKHYCPDCYSYDDDGEVILKNRSKTN